MKKREKDIELSSFSRNAYARCFKMITILYNFRLLLRDFS